jgi:iron(III) transport system permease protein
LAKIMNEIPVTPIKRPGIKMEMSFVFCSIILVLLALLVLYPVGMLVLSSFKVKLADGAQVVGLTHWVKALTNPGMTDAIFNTFNRVFISVVISFPIGILITWILCRTDVPGKSFFDFFMWLGFFLPTLPVLMGWILMMDPGFGIANKMFMSWFGLEKGPFNIYSFWGIVFAHITIRMIAAKYIFLGPAFRNMDSSMEEASRISGRNTFSTFLRIMVPVMIPAILVTLIITIIHSIESFEIEEVLGTPIKFYVFSTKIYQLVSEDNPAFEVATVLGIVILLSMIPLIFLQQFMNRKRNYSTVSSKFKSSVTKLGAMKWPAFALILGYCVFMIILPLIFLFMGTFMSLFGFFNIDHVWTLDHWKMVITDKDIIKSSWNTLKLAGGAAIFGIIFYTLIAYITVKTKYSGRGAIDFVSWLPVTIPGIILGLAFLWMFLGTPVFRVFYGTMFSLIIAVIITNMTTGVQLIKSNMVQLSSELEEASAVSGGSWIYTFRRVILPILTPVILSVGTLTFISAARNVSSIAMIVTGNNQPLSVLQLGYMLDGSYEAAAITGVFVVIFTVGVALIARSIGKRIGIHL